MPRLTDRGKITIREGLRAGNGLTPVPPGTGTPAGAATFPIPGIFIYGGSRSGGIPECRPGIPAGEGEESIVPRSRCEFRISCCLFPPMFPGGDVPGRMALPAVCIRAGRP